MDDEKLIYALNAVVWYNGIGEYILRWKDLEVTEQDLEVTEHSFIKCPLYEMRLKFSDRDYSVFEMIWMISVLLFGNYGTSPRSGWIEDISGFRNFIDKITEIYREAEDTL